MFAVVHDDRLGAPTLGQWVPRVAFGARVHDGLLLGHIVRLGRAVPVLAPPTARGQVTEVQPRQPVEYGDTLLTLGVVEGQEAVEAQAEQDEEGAAVRAPMAGTIYHRPAPGEPAFAEPGQPVRKQQTLALIEVMKTFTPIHAPRDGVLARWGVGDGDAVEADAAVAWLK